MDKPKPCPLCGGQKVELRDAASGRQNWVECLTPLCHAMGPNLASPREALVGWNRRAPMLKLFGSPEGFCVHSTPPCASCIAREEAAGPPKVYLVRAIIDEKTCLDCAQNNGEMVDGPTMPTHCEHVALGVGICRCVVVEYSPAPAAGDCDDGTCEHLMEAGLLSAQLVEAEERLEAAVTLMGRLARFGEIMSLAAEKSPEWLGTTVVAEARAFIMPWNPDRRATCPDCGAEQTWPLGQKEPWPCGPCNEVPEALA